ncbi:hypothetical protein WJX73_004125 [Symbiochloris irregularis]|uniref:Nudix hydrolase domain-containing protein n=1 Tax=Symbiochloris irregularis TaxID=706552 RepID=A0AAW1PJR7_9CHLO
MSDDGAKVLRKRDFGPAGFRWLTLTRIEWADPTGRERVWECAERQTRSQGGVDGVAIFALVKKAGSPISLVLVSQFRPPQGRTVIEVPAGLIDEGESAEAAAVREPKEETGFSGVSVQETQVGANDPGMTNTNMQAVVIEVDGDAPENVNALATPEEGEFIDVFQLPLDNLYEALQDKQKETGWDIDARLMLHCNEVHFSTHFREY